MNECRHHNDESVNPDWKTDENGIDDAMMLVLGATEVELIIIFWKLITHSVLWYWYYLPHSYRNILPLRICVDGKYYGELFLFEKFITKTEVVMNMNKPNRISDFSEFFNKNKKIKNNNKPAIPSYMLKYVGALLGSVNKGFAYLFCSEQIQRVYHTWNFHFKRKLPKENIQIDQTTWILIPTKTKKDRLNQQSANSKLQPSNNQ